MGGWERDPTWRRSEKRREGGQPDERLRSVLGKETGGRGGSRGGGV